MKAQSTLTEHIASPDDAALARPIFEDLASSEMSQVIALLPY